MKTTFQRAVQLAAHQREVLPSPSDDMDDLGLETRDYELLLKPICRMAALKAVRKMDAAPPDNQVAELAAYMTALYLGAFRAGVAYERLRQAREDLDAAA